MCWKDDSLLRFAQIIPICAILLVSAGLSELHGETEPESICYGTTSYGCLENGVKLPIKGPNYLTYSLILSGAGRTYVHSKVRDVIVSSYRSLETSTLLQ